MRLDLHDDPLPLRHDLKDTIRVGPTRVTLDLVIAAYHDGQSPEQIAEGYSTLQLADVYHTIAYYLRHREEIDPYLAWRETEAEALRARIEASQPGMEELRQRMLARKALMEQGHASPGHG